MQNHDAFLQVVQDLVVADPHSLWVHKDHTNLGDQDVDQEEVKNLPDATSDHGDDHFCRDFFAVKETSRGNLGQLDHRHANQCRVETEVVHCEGEY